MTGEGGLLQHLTLLLQALARRRAKSRRFVIHGELRDSVADKPRCKWSPARISV